MARPTKLDSKLQKQIVKLLSTGVTVADTCDAVGIAKSTFHDWVKRGEAGDEAPFSEFSDAVSRAYNAAKVKAIGTLRAAMSPYNQTQTVKKTFTETRLTRGGVPYEYKRVEETKSVTRYNGDWKAAVEYLKRRHPDEWSERFEHTGKDGADLFDAELRATLKALGIDESDVVRDFRELMLAEAAKRGVTPDDAP